MKDNDAITIVGATGLVGKTLLALIEAEVLFFELLFALRANEHRSGGGKRQGRTFSASGLSGSLLARHAGR